MSWHEVSLTWRPCYPPGPTPEGAHAIQTSLTPQEAVTLQELARDRSILEIGSAYGYSAITMALGGARNVLAVDSHDGHEHSLEVMQGHLRDYGVQDRVTILITRSWDLIPLLKGRFGLVFIDGDHRFRTVLLDIWTSQDRLCRGGQIALHDYGEASTPGVAEAVKTAGLRGCLLCDTLWVSDP